MENGTFTWNNRRTIFSQIVEKLYRFMFKGNLKNFKYNIKVQIISNSSSDDCPIKYIKISKAQQEPLQI